MRISCIAFLVFLGLGLISCNRGDTARRDHTAARQAGQEAYRASQELKHGAKEAVHDLRDAGKDLREGWTEAKHEDSTRRKK